MSTRTVTISALADNRVSLALEVVRQLALVEGEFAVSGSVGVMSKDPLEPKPEAPAAPQLEAGPEVAPVETVAVSVPPSGATGAAIVAGQARCVHCGNPEVAHVAGESGRGCPTIPGKDFQAS